jgi:hypothetical protein
VGNKLLVVLEVGPKGKKIAALAPDWPGLERGAKTEEAAISELQSYRTRYETVAKSAGLGAEFAELTTVEVVERYVGTGSTDFWGISFALSSVDQRKPLREELDRELGLMRACWTFFDGVRSRVTAEMMKGPRGGGRDRDRIVRHTFGTEQDWGKKLGLGTPGENPVVDEKGVKEFRERYVTAIRTYYAEDKMAKSWPLRFLIRHTAYHTMDHAWEMEDKDLTS